MNVYVCKMCGRAITIYDADPQRIPIYCYFDRIQMLECIDVERAEKMGITIGDKYTPFPPLAMEFPGDICFNPFTGEMLPPQYDDSGLTLNNWQLNKFADFISEEDI